MSNDVERLAEMLWDASWKRVPEGKHLSWKDVHPPLREPWLSQASELLASGVTLPTPPRATPLEAAAREIKPWLKDGLKAEPAAWDAIAAAVGALSDADCWHLAVGPERKYTATEQDTYIAGRVRAALLARLTEGGTA